jgi:hypothetical protein
VETGLNILPSEKGEAEKRHKAELEKLAEARLSELRHDFTLTFETEHGKRVLQWLRDRCGHNKIILSANRQNGGIDTMMTTFAAMELNLYLEMRNYIPNKILQELENDNRIRPSGSASSSGSDHPKRSSGRRASK